MADVSGFNSLLVFTAIIEVALNSAVGKSMLVRCCSIGREKSE